MTARFSKIVTTGPLRPRLWMAALALACGCSSPGPEAAYRDYLARLGNTLGVDPPPSVPRSPPRPPRSGQLQIELPGDKLDALDFLALSGCELQVTIGRRNSSLGRVARPSQWLLLELEFLRLAPDCIEKLHGESRDELAVTLDAAWRLKQRQLPARIFNATLGSDEYRSFWLPGRQQGLYPAVAGSRASTAAASVDARVERWLAGDYSADGRAFELDLGDIAGGGGGVLLMELLVQQDWRARADRMVDARMARGPLCAPSIRHGAADILPNVVRRYFVGGIQPRAANMNSRQYALLPPVLSLEQQLGDTLPLDYRQWMAERDDALRSALAAPRRHVRQIEKILAPCGGTQVPAPEKIVTLPSEQSTARGNSP